jgi:hypothetical protein
MSAILHEHRGFGNARICHAGYAMPWKQHAPTAMQAPFSRERRIAIVRSKTGKKP